MLQLICNTFLASCAQAKSSVELILQQLYLVSLLGFNCEFQLWCSVNVLISTIKFLSLVINTQSRKYNNILNPTIKCFMFDYKYTQPSTKSSTFRSKDRLVMGNTKIFNLIRY